MSWKKIAVTAAAAGAALAAVLPAYADAPYWGHSHGYRTGHWEHRDHRGHTQHPHRNVVVVQERPYVTLLPRVVVLSPGPVYAPYPQSTPAPSQ